MPKKHRVFGYQELMNALKCANRKELVAGVIILALDSWRTKTLSNYAMSAILAECQDRIKNLI